MVPGEEEEGGGYKGARRPPPAGSVQEVSLRECSGYLPAMPDNGEIHEVLQGSEGLMVQLMSQRAEGEEWGQWLRAPLLRACEAADADLVDKLLKAGADGRNRGSEGNDRPLLHAAAKGGSDRILLALLHAGCKPDIDFRLQDDEDQQGYTALQLVVGKRAEKREAARVLMTAGADVTGALIIAIRRGHELVALDLLLAGADPNERLRRECL